MKKVIITDVDDVLLAWEYPFHTWMETHGYVKQKDAFQWDVSRTYNIPEDKAIDLIKLFNDSAAIGFLPPLRDAQYYVKLLHEKHQYQFVVVTSSTSDEYAKKLRIRNLKKMFGDNAFLDFHILGLHESKETVLKELSEKYYGAYWVEDSPPNAVAGYDVGFKALLMLHGRNKAYAHYHQYRAVASWEEIYDLVIRGI